MLLGWILPPAQAGADSPPRHDIHFLREITGGAAGPFSLPSDVAIGKARVYVVDGGNHRVVAFGDHGDLLFTIGEEGAGAGQFQGPVGIDVAANGEVYVADTGNHRVQVFNADGAYLRGFPIRSGGEPIRPIDVAVDAAGKELYVSGNNNHKLMVYSTDGQWLREWGRSGRNSGEFRYPATIAVLADARLAVVDILNTRVQVFDPAGRFSIEVGEWGVLPGQLFRPKGVAIDGAQRFYISDSYLNVIQVFEDTGAFLYVLNIAGGARALATPVGLAIDDDQLYVAEMLENRVSVFGLGR